MTGNNGCNQPSSSRFVLFPIHSQTSCGPARLLRTHSAEYSFSPTRTVPRCSAPSSEFSVNKGLARSGEEAPGVRAIASLFKRSGVKPASSQRDRRSLQSYARPPLQGVLF